MWVNIERFCVERGHKLSRVELSNQRNRNNQMRIMFKGTHILEEQVLT